MLSRDFLWRMLGKKSWSPIGGGPIENSRYRNRPNVPVFDGQRKKGLGPFVKLDQERYIEPYHARNTVWPMYFYRPHPKDDGRLYYQSVHTCGGGGTPSQVSVRGGTPSQVQVGGVPHPRSRCGGYLEYPPMGSGWGTPSPLDLGWGTPWTWDQVTPPPGPGTRYPPPTRSGLDRAAQWVLATRRAVCLLRSPRRTFLFIDIFNWRQFQKPLFRVLCWN